jgi:RHS repeat-associated protein
VIYLCACTGRAAKHVPNGYTIAADDGLSYFAFDRNGRHLNTIDAITGQKLLSFDYDDAGRLAAVHDANGRVTKVSRDVTSGRATAIVSPDGLTSELSYASNGWLATVKNPTGEAHQFTLSDLGLLAQETDVAGRKHSFEYDSTGRLTKDTEASGSFQTLARSTDQSTVTRTTARGLAYVHQRSTAKTGGELRTTTLPDGRVVTTTSTPGHAVTQQEDGTKVDTEFASDPRFGLVAKYPTTVTVTTPAGLKAKLTSSRSIELASQIDPNSVKSYKTTTGLNGTTLATEQFDVATLTRSSTTFGVTTTTKLDSSGRVTEIDPPAGRLPIQISYDSLGRPSQIARGSRVLSALTYDTNGFLASSSDALNNATSYAHDLAGRILSTEQAAAKTQFTYKTGDLTALLTPSGSSHGFGYDNGGRNVLYAAPTVSSLTATNTTYTYGVDDALETITLPSGRKLERSIDTQGHLASWKTPEATVAATYDSKTGNIATLSTDSEAVAYAWDGSLLLSLSWSGTVAGKASWKYNNDLRLVSETVGSNSVSLTYDSYGRLSQVGTLTLGYASDGTNVASTTCAQISETLGYSSDYGELSDHKVTGNSGSSALYQATFTRDALGRITKKDETVGSATTSNSYEYDALGRLTTVTRAGVATKYAYDANGNRTDSGAQVDAQDRILKFNGVSYAYNDDGQLTSKTGVDGTTTTYTYDTLGQLRSVQLPSKRIDYVIDPAGRRVGKSVDGKLSKGFLYDARNRVVAELDGTGAIVSQFVYGSRRNVPDLMLRGSKTYRLVSDYLGSVRLVVDTSTSAVAQKLDYDAWGNVSNDTSSGFQPFGFAGGLYDADTGLARFGARDYDPVTGRWTAKDPILFGGGQADLYVYIGDDPVNRRDPSGLNGFYTIGSGWDLGFIGGVDETRGKVIDFDSKSVRDYVSANAAIGLYIGGGATLAGWGYYMGTMDDFLNSWGIRFQLEMVDITLNFSKHGFAGFDISGGVGDAFGVAWIGGNTRLEKAPCP